MYNGIRSLLLARGGPVGKSHLGNAGRACIGSHWSRACSTARQSKVIRDYVSKHGPATARPIEEASVLHGSFYNDASYVEAENKQIFFNGWFAAGHDAEIGRKGVKVVNVGQLSYILTRDRKGVLHCFFNSCTHRGLRLCKDSQKNCAQLRCPYHWWAFRLDGTLKSTGVFKHEKQEEFKQRSGLKPVRFQVFAGIFFLNPSGHAGPLKSHLGDLPKKLERYMPQLDDSEWHGDEHFSIACDWKLKAENFFDFYHIDSMHTETLGPFQTTDNTMPYQGSGQYIGLAVAPMTESGSAGDLTNFKVAEGLQGAEKDAGLFFHIFPNISLSIYPYGIYSLIMFPGQKPGEMREQLCLLMFKNAKLDVVTSEEYQAQCKEMLDFVVRVNHEDIESVEDLQRGMPTMAEGNLPGIFMPAADWVVHRFQNMLLKAVRNELIDDSLMPDPSAVHRPDFATLLERAPEAEEDAAALPSIVEQLSVDAPVIDKQWSVRNYACVPVVDGSILTSSEQIHSGHASA